MANVQYSTGGKPTLPIPPYTPPKYEPYTYWHSEKENRAFLLVCIEKGITEPYEIVVLIEWGKTRHEGVFIPLKDFDAAVASGQLKQFTPKL